MVEFAQRFGIAYPGKAGYRLRLEHFAALTLKARKGSVKFKPSRAEMPEFLPVKVEGLNDNRSVQLLDRARKPPDHRALPITDGST